MMLPTSLPPNRSPSWQVFSPGVTQEDCTFRMFSRYSREIASVLQVLDRGRFFLHEPAERRVLALEGPGNERREPARLVLDVADDVEVVHALLDGLSAAEHHGGGGAHSELMRRSCTSIQSCVCTSAG